MCEGFGFALLGLVLKECSVYGFGVEFSVHGCVEEFEVLAQS